MILSYWELLLILVLLYSKISCNDKIITYNYNIFSNAFYMYSRLKSGPTLFSRLDLNFQYTTISNKIHEIQYTKSKYLQSMTIDIEKDIKINGEERSDSCELIRGTEIIAKIPELSFLFLSPSDRVFYPNDVERYAMAYNIPNKNHSITHQLKANKIIEETSFTFHILKTTAQRYIYFGGIPEEITKGLDKGACSVKKGYNQWACDLSKIIIKNIPYAIAYSVYFSTVIREMRVPQKVYDFIIEQMFIVALDKKICRQNKDLNRMECHCVMIDLGHHFSFVFDKFILRLRSQDLFIQHEGFCEFMIVSNTEDNDRWIIGHFFLEKYTIKFDYDNKQIVFYSNQGIDLINNNTNLLSKTMISIIMIIIALGLLLLSYTQFIIKKATQ